MEFYISYKGKPYGPPMSREEAEMKLLVLSKSFDGLGIVSAERLAASIGESVASGQSDADSSLAGGRRPRMKKINER